MEKKKKKKYKRKAKEKKSLNVSFWKGVLFLVLPWKATTFDRWRATSTFEHLAQKHVRESPRAE